MHLIILLSAFVAMVSSQNALCYDVYPRDCWSQRNIVCTQRAYRNLAQQSCRYSCGYCTVVAPVQTTTPPPSPTTTTPTPTPSPTTTPDDLFGPDSSEVMPVPSSPDQEFRTAYLNTNAKFLNFSL